MVSVGHGTLSFKGSVPEGRYSSLADYGMNAHKKKLEYNLKKKRWEVKINLSQYNPRKAESTITKVSTLTKRKTLESVTKICLSTFALHVMKEDTLQEIFLETKIYLTRGRETRKHVMLML